MKGPILLMILTVWFGTTSEAQTIYVSPGCNQ